MDIPNDHKVLLARRDFAPQCDTSIFSAREKEILARYGCWMEALAIGQIAPITDAQRRFIRVVQEEVEPESEFETAWLKLKLRRQYEV